MTTRYTQVPRATLWLVQGGELLISGSIIEVGSFYIGKSVITNEQYEAYLRACGAPRVHSRSPLSPGDDHPAVGVTWQDAVGYCDWYAHLAKKPFRLPTEAEWQLACGGFGDAPSLTDPQVWHRDNSDGHCHPVESSRVNSQGLHDMLGNVWEWTAERVLRGGSFRTAMSEMGSAKRRLEQPGVDLDDVGFRIVRSL